MHTSVLTACPRPCFLLQAYAAAFFIIPGVRTLLNAQKNALISAQNTARMAAAQLLLRGDKWLQEVRGSNRMWGCGFKGSVQHPCEHGHRYLVYVRVEVKGPALLCPSVPHHAW